MSRDGIELAVFPLPGVVLFPGTLMPLHIFESRYRKMTADLLAGDRQLSVALIREDAPTDEHEAPEFADISGIGEIVDHQKLPDGRYNILVLGRSRARLEELPFVPPYRRARATLLEDTGTSPPEADVAALAYAASRFTALVKKQQGSFDVQLPSVREPGRLADACAQYLVIEATDRQRLLETLDTRERVRLCTETLTVQHAMLSGPRVLS